MKFTSRQGIEFELRIDNPLDMDKAVRAIIGSTPFKEAIDDFARATGYRAWERLGDIQDDAVNELVTVLFDHGEDAAVQHMLDNRWDRSASDFLHYGSGEREIRELSKGIATAYTKAAGIVDDADLFGDLLAVAVSEAAEERMIELDRSQPYHLFDRGDMAQVVFLPGADDGRDTGTRHVDSVSTTETMVPDHGFMQLLKLANVSPPEFVAAAAKRGIDLLSPEFHETATEQHRADYLAIAEGWRFACDVFDGKQVDTLSLTAPWLLDDDDRALLMATIRLCKDHARPQGITTTRLEEIVENAGYGGRPVLYMQLPLRELVSGGFAGPFTADNAKIGLHDFRGGSGYLLKSDEAVLVDPSSGRLAAPSSIGTTPDEVYGRSRRGWDVETAPAEVDGWVECAAGLWRSLSDPAGAYAEIVEDVAIDDDLRHLRLHTFEQDGTPGGSFARGRFFSDLSEAKVEGAGFVMSSTPHGIERPGNERRPLF